MILIVYYFSDIGTYVGDEPPQQDDKMDEVVEDPIAHRPFMPQRSNLEFWIKLANHICHLFTTKGVWSTYAREIMQELDMGEPTKVGYAFWKDHG